MKTLLFPAKALLLVAAFGLFCGARAQTASLPDRILTLERGIQVVLETGEGSEHYRSMLNAWFTLTAELKRNPEILQNEIAGTRGRKKLEALRGLQSRLSLDENHPRILQFRLRAAPVESQVVAIPSVAAPAFAPGDLVLTDRDDVGEVVAVQNGKVTVRGGITSIGEFAPAQLVREAKGPVDGVEVGSFVRTEAEGWGKVVRVWEDGRIEVDGKWFLPLPVHAREMAEIRPPQPTWFERFAKAAVKTCVDLLMATRPVVF